MSFANDPKPDEHLPFQVNLHAVVELLSRNIYSHPSIYLRELIQNARDAVQSRIDAGHMSRDQALISITPTGPGQPELVVRDNGVGVRREEVASLLATVGQSSKRDIFDLPRTDRLGQFGIGLLSCFMIADSIVVETRPVSGPPSRWVGRADGTFSVTDLEGHEADSVPVGTTVRLRPRGDELELTTYARVWDLAVEFAEFLPVTVEVLGPRGTDRYVNRTVMYGVGLTSTVDGDVVHEPGVEVDELTAMAESADLENLLSYGEELVGAEPLAVISIDVPETHTHGTAFVLPYQPPPGARQGTRAYLGGLLVGESVPDLLPEWAFFVRVLLDSTGLTPTASREGFVNDESLAHTKRAIATRLKTWVKMLAERDQMGLQRFLGVHDLALRSLAKHDEELARIVLPHLTFETSQGRMLLSDVVARDPRVRFAASTEEFRQIAAVIPPGQLVLNAGYVYEADLMRMVPTALDHATTEQVQVHDVIAEFAQVRGRDAERAWKLEASASEALWGLECEVEVRAFSPQDVPALYVVDPHVLRAMELRRLEESTDGFWGDLMREISGPGEPGRASASTFEESRAAHGAVPGANPSLATLVLNWNSPLVTTLAGAEDPLIASRTIRLLYVQAILAGHNPLRPADRALLNESLADMLSLSTSLMMSDISADEFLDAEADGEDEPS